ncbi:hypothetical protein B0H10DRAFT_2232593 [Mycena sp. CBHHK59/15]|nr:hypothetical protein B0H10DRAFT_2232593 [Mycena sp. CBHHK59/15]
MAVRCFARLRNTTNVCSHQGSTQANATRPGQRVILSRKVRLDRHPDPLQNQDQLDKYWVVAAQTNHWWKVTLTIPEFEQYERVQFAFDPGCEAMIFDTDGLPLQGITGGYGGDRRVEYIIPPAARKAGVAHLVIKMSCNGMFRMGGGGIGPPDVEGAEGKDGDKESSSAAVVDGGDGILHIMVMTHWWRLRSLYPAPSSLAPRGGGGG